MKLPQLKGVRGSGPKDIGQEDRGGGAVVVLVAVVFVLGTLWWGAKWVCINERQGAGQGRSSRAGQGRHGPEAALLGAGEASEEVTIAVVLSRCQRTCGG